MFHWRGLDMRYRKSVPDWIAVEWMQGDLRAWAMDRDGQVLMKVRSAQGLAQIASQAFETVLFNLVRPWLLKDRTPVVVGGAAAIVPGLRMQPAASVPCRLADLPAIVRSTDETRLILYTLPGLQSPAARGADLTEDSVIRGVIVQQPEFDGVVCIPGAQSLWVRLRAGEVLNWQTFMTGELVDLLAPPPREVAAGLSPVLDQGAFDTAAAATLSKPELLAHHLAVARDTSDPARSRLYGHLIAAELAATRARWGKGQVLLVGATDQTDPYRRVLTTQGVAVQSGNRDELALSGLRHAYQGLSETMV